MAKKFVKRTSLIRLNTVYINHYYVHVISICHREAAADAVVVVVVVVAGVGRRRQLGCRQDEAVLRVVPRPSGPHRPAGRRAARAAGGAAGGVGGDGVARGRRLDPAGGRAARTRPRVLLAVQRVGRGR